MSDGSGNPHALPATLELDGELRLGGMLAAADDGRLQLGSVRLLHGRTKAGAVSLRSGASGILRTVTGAPPWQPADEVAVTVQGISGKTVFIQISNTYDDAARHCMLALSSTEAPAAEAIAAGTDSPDSQPSYRTLLEKLTARSLQQAEQRFSKLLADLRLYLMEMTLRSGGSWGKKNHDVAADAMKKHNAAIMESLSARLGAYWDELLPDRPVAEAEESSPPDEPRLGLVDIDEFEHDLAVERLTKTGTELYDVPLECLTLRLAELIQADPRKVRLPIHVAQLCTAFNSALTDRGIPHEVAPDIFDFFDKHFIQDLGSYYAELNRFLEKSGILPDIETEIAEQGSLLRKPAPVQKTPRRDASCAPEGTAARDNDTAPEPPEWAAAQQLARALSPQPAPAPAATGAGTGAAGGGDFADKLYSSLIQAMSARREAERVTGSEDPLLEAAAAAGTPGPDPTGTPRDAIPAGGKLADTRSLANVLSALQKDGAAREAVRESHSLREYLAANRARIDGLDGTEGMTADSLNQLDMVDNLFGTIRSQLDTASELRPSLGNLQIPLAKLSMLEPQFMLDRRHPARGVVDQIAQLATTANFPNKALESRVQDIVDEIVEGYDDDSEVFRTALAKIDQLVAQQERALSRNVERVIRTQEGQEKLRRARQVVSQAIAERIRPPAAPAVLMDLVENGWRDLLVLTHIKEGAESTAWQEQLAVLDTLTDWLQTLQEGSVSNEEVAALVRESEAFTDRIGKQLAAALPTNVSYQQTLQDLKNVLSGAVPITLRQVTDVAAAPEAADVRARIDDLPRLKRWVKRVEQLESGNWLSYRDREGRPRRMQLAWISEDKDRYIFVNERGQKNADLSAIQLARQLSRGVQPPAPVDALGLVDRSMYDTLEQLQKTLSFARNHDSLTRLINRETFLDQLGRALRHAQTRNSQHAVLYLDIDQFGLVNELYDRVNGDQVLLEFAKLLAQLHGKKTSSARVQGDEFAILLLDRNHQQSLDFAEKVRRDIEATSVEIEGEKVSFTVSIGVAPVLEHSPEVTAILESACAAMHIAKQNGRNRVVPFAEDQALAVDFRKSQARTRQDLEQALETDRFMLRAQPIVQTLVDGGATVKRHYELLLGWRDKEGMVTSPGEFIRSAERYGFMTLVDRWVVREAFGWISQLMDDQKVVPHLSINLSGSSITDDAFMEYLFEQISEFGVGTNRICFEITETGTISNLVKAADFVRAFRNIGCKFSIDDFGTGLASHDFLRELPVDYVKIDGTFVKEIDSNRNDYAMARSINDLAHFLGQETIAESVENEEIISKLQEIGVDYLQGWGVGKPRPLSEIAGELSSIEK